jgi:hypothetical protein
MQRVNNLSRNRWAIFIDLEGFSALYDKEDLVLLSLGELMEGIYNIGCNYFPESPDRLFAHQLGDGFVIVSEFHEDSLDRPISIAISLLRHVASSGRFAKASISEGQFSDIPSCYPSTVTNSLGSDKRVRIGSGIMTIFPVMGTALIRAFSIGKNSPSGPMLAVAAAETERIPAGLVMHEISSQDIVLVDWIHSHTELSEKITERAGLRSPTAEKLTEILHNYCHSQNIKEEWKANVVKYLGVKKK